MMVFRYVPASSIIVDHVIIEFGETRELVRVKLGGNYKESDSGGQRRDIYQNLNSMENYFFLNYDHNNLLKEVELHHCEKVQVFDVTFDFNDDLDTIVMALSKYAGVTRTGEGEYFFKDLKISLINQEQMGGNGNALGYFYCADDVTHLEEV